MLSITKLANPWARPIWHCAETTSTMDETHRLAQSAGDRAQELIGTIVQADFQSAGLGRFADRKWTGTSGSSLMFTIILAPKPGLALSLVMAAGIIQWLDSLNISVQIKWPNDIVADGGKLAGILVHGSRGLLHCGIGINLQPVGFVAPIGKMSASSLSQLGLVRQSQSALIELLPFLFKAYHTDSTLLRSYVEGRLLKLGQETSVDPGLPGTAKMIGIVRGLTEQGALLLETEAGIQVIVSGE